MKVRCCNCDKWFGIESLAAPNENGNIHLSDKYSIYGHRPIVTANLRKFNQS